jgi:hypothetical protein
VRRRPTAPKEKKLLFEAVIGVDGVLRICRCTGLTILSSGVGSCNAAIFSVVGMLKGPTEMGGSWRGCRFFLPCEAPGFNKYKDLRLLALRLVLFVVLILSKTRLGFLLSSPCASPVSLGDSYALGIAGTGGTSSSSSPTLD